MSKIGIFLLLIYFGIILGGGPLVFQVRYLTGTFAGDLGLVEDPDGYFVTTGQSYLGGFGDCNVYLFKKDQCGRLIWFKAYGTGNSEGGMDLTVAQDGGYVVVVHAGNDDHIMKTDKNGNLLWVKRYPGFENSSRIKTTSDGGFIVAGQSSGTAALLKINGNGNAQWLLQINGFGIGLDVVELPTGNFVLLGYDPNKTCFLSEISSTGTLLWTRLYNGFTLMDWAARSTLLLLNDGLMVISSQSNDVSVLKVDFNGNIIWARRYGGGGNDYPRHAVFCKDGGVAITGYENSFGGGDYDHFILKLDNTGNIQWVRSYGDALWSRAQAIVQTNDGGFIITGNTGTSPTTGGIIGIYMVKTDSAGFSGCFTYTGNWATTDLFPSSATVSPTTSISVPEQDISYSQTDVNVNQQYLCINCTSFAHYVYCPSSLEVHFVDSSLCKPTSWTWYFGDGTSSSEQNPIHVYSTPGIYNVTLVANVSITGCADTVVKQITITSQKTADFVANNVCFGSQVSFNDASLNAVQYLWEFGDGATSSLPSPSHIYLQPDTYLVTLHITTSNNCVDTEVKPIIVYPLPNAQFTTNNICANQQATITNQTTILWGNVSYYWDLGDGTTTNTTNVNHNYLNPGQYTIQLIATSDFGCKDTFFKVITINPVPNPQFTSQNKCQYDQIPFINQSNIAWGNMTYVWDFGDGSTSNLTNPQHLYSSPGAYTVVLHATSDSGCYASVSQVVSVYPVPDAAFSASNACDGNPVNFTNNTSISWGGVSYQWHFGDGTTSSIPTPSHVYPQYGSYNITLIAKSDKSCYDTAYGSVVVNPVPQVSFTATDVCEYLPVTFTNLSTIAQGNLSYTWYFGDGNTSNTSSPVYQYSGDGLYIVTLLAVSDSGCQASFISPVNVYAEPIASFTVPNGCEQSPVLFQNNSSGALNYTWDFGDGSSSNLSSPVHIYSQEGTYNVQLTVSSGNNCTATYSYVITINPKPDLNFSFSNKCIYDTVYFSNLSTIPSGNVAYQWHFGDGQSTSALNASHLYSNAGNYIVTLIGISDSGCISTLTSVVEIYPQPVAGILAENKCINAQPVFFKDKSTISAGSIVSYYWDFGDGNSSIQINPMHSYDSSGVYTITHIVTSDKQCKDTAQTTVEIYPAPQAIFPGTRVEGCPLLCVTLTSNSIGGGSANIDSVIWLIENNNTGYTSPYLLCLNESGYYDVTLIVKNSYGCYDTLTKQDYIFVFPTPKAFFTIDSTKKPIYDPVISVWDGSIGASSLIYYWGDNTSDTIRNPTHIYSDTGKYIITQYVKNVYGCKDSFPAEVYIFPEVFIWVPNAFTPNSDGINDSFMWKGFGLVEDENYFMMIYDRWGQKIWETNKFEPWPGTFKSGKPCPEDVYVFIIQVKDIFGKIHKFKGTVTLLR